ncbi:3-phosphoinositide-dependent protein kinase 1-like isoform X2 [Mya arenaria]|uniref:3-phosphoinositide-dependent protein kinase 1-like isoform X2 n=1 Tax=Mya arenaria TaxID=6604 RepID=UPI0022E7ADA9|nr:3-phosphoinositide-dependent protein kinase 1-like isoform X2 [Mya arenaria]
MSSSSVGDSPGEQNDKPQKKTPNDFVFGKVIGEGSFATVYLAKEISTGAEFAIKVLEKKHIMRERKTEYVMREKEVLMKLNHPFFIRLYFTFQDVDRLYFVLNYARRGELLDYLHRLSSFDEDCSRHYTAEIVKALEYLHGVNIVHRDLKPENILLNDEMHIQITDFGSAKIIKGNTDNSQNENEPKRKNSFVGTAQYVSPEVLTSKHASKSSDLWALGCILYQFLSGEPPFRGGHEYQIFQKITKLEYEFPEGFSPVARDLVEKLLVLEPDKRLGSDETGGFEHLKGHGLFKGVDWDNIETSKPPELVPYLPATASNPESCWSTMKPGLTDKRIGEILTSHFITEAERKERLEHQAQTNEYHKFTEGHLILKQGLIDKRKGLFARRRMFLLTEGPHLYYVDPSNKVLKGQIPWSKDLKTEQKNFKIFFVHTPNRTYYLEEPQKRAVDWCKEIDKVCEMYYGK